MVCFNCTRFLRIKSEKGGGAKALLSPSHRGTVGKWLTVQINMILGDGTLALALFFYAYADGSMLAHLALQKLYYSRLSDMDQSGYCTNSALTWTPLQE